MGNFSVAYSAAVERLQYHAQAGRILEGFRIVTDITQEVFGKADFPHVRVMMPSLTETIDGNIMRLEIRLQFTCSTWNKGSALEQIQAVEKVADALTTAHDGTGRPDNGLAGTGYAGGRIEYGDSYGSGNNELETSLNTNLTMVLKARASELANRRN